MNDAGLFYFRRAILSASRGHPSEALTVAVWKVAVTTHLLRPLRRCVALAQEVVTVAAMNVVAVAPTAVAANSAAAAEPKVAALGATAAAWVVTVVELA